MLFDGDGYLFLIDVTRMSAWGSYLREVLWCKKFASSKKMWLKLTVFLFSFSYHYCAKPLHTRKSLLRSRIHGSAIRTRICWLECQRMNSWRSKMVFNSSERFVVMMEFGSRLTRAHNHYWRPTRFTPTLDLCMSCMSCMRAAVLRMDVPPGWNSASRVLVCQSVGLLF